MRLGRSYGGYPFQVCVYTQAYSCYHNLQCMKKLHAYIIQNTNTVIILIAIVIITILPSSEEGTPTYPAIGQCYLSLLGNGCVLGMTCMKEEPWFMQWRENTAVGVAVRCRGCGCPLQGVWLSIAGGVVDLVLTHMIFMLCWSVTVRQYKL